VAGDLVNDAADAPLFAHNIRTVAAYMAAGIFQERGERS